MNLLDVIKSAGVQAVDASYPLQVSIGTVEDVDPIAVQVDQRTILTKEFLIIPEQLVRYEVDLTHDHSYRDQSGSGGDQTRQTAQALQPIVIRSGLQLGDSVLLLRVQGGEQFVILDKVVKP